MDSVLEYSGENFRYLANYILKSDTDFQPLLSDRVEMDEYIEKLVNHAYIFYYKRNEEIQSVLAAYMNTDVVYVSYFHILNGARGTGISNKMLEHIISQAKRNKKSAINLTVRQGSRAYFLYAKYGFTVKKEIDYSSDEVKGYEMELTL